MTRIHHHRARPANRPTSASKPGLDPRWLSTLRKALQEAGGDEGKGGAGASNSAKPLQAITRSAGSANTRGSSKPRASAAGGLLGGLDALSLPAKPTPARLKKLIQDIRQGIRGDSGLSPTQPNVLDPSTLTPLQKSLFTALNGMPREELQRQPELLKAVREGLATEGGQQLALAINLLDANLVGDLSQPSRRRLLNGNSLIEPRVLVRVLFKMDRTLPASLYQAAVDWIGNAQQSEAGRQKLNALCQRPQMTFKLGEDRGAADGPRKGPWEEERVIHLGRDFTPGQLGAKLDQLAAAAPPDIRGDLSLDPLFMLDETLVFDNAVPQRTQEIIAHAVKHSPTLRNMLLRIQATHGKIQIGVDANLPGDATLQLRQILLKPAAPEDMASSILFELSNASHHDLFGLARRETMPLAKAEAQEPMLALQIDRMRRSPAAAQEFLNWVDSDQRNEYLLESNAPRVERSIKRGESEQDYEAYLLEDRSLVWEYMEDVGGEPSIFHAALESAVSTEYQESNSVLLHAQVSRELEDSVGDLARAHPVLDRQALAALGPFRTYVEQVSPGNFMKTFIDEQFRSGHLSGYYNDHLDGRSDTLSKPSVGGEGAGAADDAAVRGKGGRSPASAARPAPDAPAKADPAADAALSEAGAQAGTAARGALDAAVGRHGAGDRGALDKAVHEGTLAQSQALAAQLLEHPHLAAALRLGGKALGAAALAALTLQLGQAIHTDVKNGDRSAPATRKVLEEILGGTALGIGGAAVGARIGVALGSLAGPVSAAVGGFIGGLFGGALGYAAGAKLVDDAIAAEKQPLAHLIDGLVGGKAPKHDGAAIVKSSGSEDNHVNAKELRQGLESLGLEVDIGKPQLAALVNAYGSGGVGALSPQDLDRAFADGALRIDGPGKVTVEPLEFTLNLDTAGQEGRAANIAKRLVNLGSSEEGADRLLNTHELMSALEDAGCSRSIDEGRFERLVAAYDRSGNGALSEKDIAQAIQDGALEFDTDGGVFVHDQGITGAAGDSAANIALRVVKAGSSDDLLANAGELKQGMKETGFDSALNGEEWQQLIAVYGDQRAQAIGPEGVAKAIADGALLIDADGGVSADRTVLWPHPAALASLAS